MTEVTAAPTRTKHWRRVRLILLIGILVLLVVRVGLDLWANHRITVEIARLETQYGSLDESTLGVPPVPDSDNRARAVRAAAALTAFAPSKDLSELRRALGLFVKSPASTPVPDDLTAFVEANRDALRVADTASTRRLSDWEIDYRNGSDLPPFMEIRTLSDAIYLAALLDLEGGRPDDAARAITSGLAVSASLRQEPNLIAQLIRAAIGIQHFEAVQRLVTQAEPSKASLEELARRLVESRTPDLVHTGLLGELKHFNAALTHLENGNVHSAAADLVPRSPFWLGPLARLGRPLIRLVRIRYLQQVGYLLDVQAGPRPRPAFAAPERWGWMRRLDNSTAGLERTIETGDLFNSELGATELAVALRRFRLDRGTYPDDLSALVPAYLASIPLDLFTGQPPVYARQGAGFRLRARPGTSVSSLAESALEWNVPK